MGSYRKALNKIAHISPTKKKQIEKLISEWSGPKGKKKGKGSGSHIVPNIEREFYLHLDRMVSILNRLHQNRLLKISETSKFEKTYLAECYNHVLQGHEIKKSYPTIVGRAVTRASFTQYLKNRYNLKRYEAESIVYKLVNGKRL